ncbi:MAG: YggS family pyridoxal phosphate-dependent enzyme [Acidobacteria bacterium]|nr:YggS family pyridoxal phosphate-dependent enzyme [Acidobacteriota bacterium]
MTEPIEAVAGLRERLDQVREKIEGGARRCGREPKEITLVAVSKTQPVSVVREALGVGVTDVGENRVQEAESKIAALGNQPARWHLIGHLQANKARRAVKLFDVVHTLDSVSLAHRLDRSCAEEDRSELPVLIQVDLAGETAKSGVLVTGLPELVTAVNECSRLRFQGLMGMSHDYEVAIEEGATIVRVGTAIFGERIT